MQKLSVCWIALHVLCFSLSAVIVKTIISEINVAEQLLLRALFTTGVVSLLTPAQKLLVSSKKYWRLLLLRGVLGFIGSYGTFYTFSTLPIPIAMVLAGLTPVLVMLFGSIILKEKVPLDIYLYSLLISIAVYFSTGQPLTSGEALSSQRIDIFIAIGGTCATALSFLTVRKLASKISSSIIIFWFALCSLVGFFFASGFTFSVISSSTLTKFYLALLCVLGVLSDFTKTKAHKCYPAWFVSLCSIGTVPVSGFFAWIILDQSLLSTQWFWIVVIMFFLFLSIYRTRRR